MVVLEIFVDVVFRNFYKDVDFYLKFFIYCKKYENFKDLCGFIMKLFGLVEDRKIVNVVVDWFKGKKYEGFGVVEDKENVG